MLWRRSLDAVLVLPPAVDQPMTLAGTGAGLWDILAVPTSTDDLVGALAARHGAAPAVVKADLAPVLAELATLGVIEAPSSPSDQDGQPA